MTIVYPEGTPTLGNTKVAAVAAVADMTAPKLATEVNAASSVDGSCYIYPAGWNPGGSTARGTKPPRLCSKKQQETLGRTSFSLADLQYVYDPQADDTAPENALKAALPEGTEVFLVERIGLDAEETDFAVGQKTRTHHVKLGPQIPSGDRTDENGEFFLTQAVSYVNDGPVDGVIAA